MGFFHQPKPRHFHHEPIYYDEHRDRVRRIEKRAKEEIKAKENHTFNSESIRGAFTSQVGKRKQTRNRFLNNAMLANTGALIVIILVLILVWIYLQK